MAGRTVALRLCEVVDEDVARGGSRDDLLPLDCLDVAEVVVVQHTHRPVQDVWKEKIHSTVQVHRKVIQRKCIYDKKIYNQESIRNC